MKTPVFKSTCIISERNLKDDDRNHPQLLQGLIYDTIPDANIATGMPGVNNGKFPCTMYMDLTYLFLQSDQV